MLLIDNDAVSSLLDMPTCIDAQERAFLGLLTGASIARPRIDTYVPCERPDGYYRWGSAEGASDGVLAVRLKSDIVYWPTDAKGHQVEQKYCVRPGIYCGLVLLFSTRNGEPLAILNDGVLQQMRVGAAAGLGAKYLARADSRTVGLIGSGGMARTFLAAFKAVRDIRRVNVYSRSAERREAFARDMSTKLNIEVVPQSSAQDAVHEADILATCTDSMTPVFDVAWLESGMHVANLGPYEISAEAMTRFDVVVKQGEDGLPMEESERYRRGIGHSFGAYLAGTQEELKRLPPPKKAKARDWPHFVDLASGRIAGRTAPEQITHYSAIGNFGLQFSSIGAEIYRRAKQRGVGRELPTEWFLQEIRN
jgi:alanine dehydrogenase